MRYPYIQVSYHSEGADLAHLGGITLLFSTLLRGSDLKMVSRNQIDEKLIEFLRNRGGEVLQREIVSSFRAQHGPSYPYTRLQTLADQGMVEKARTPDGKVAIRLLREAV